MVDIDFKQLGLDREKNLGLKRLRGVVIDAKPVYLLKGGNEGKDKHDELTSVAGMKTKVIGNSETQAAIKLFLRTVRAQMNKRNSLPALLSNGTVRNDVNGLMIDGEKSFVFRLSCMYDHGGKKGDGVMEKVKNYINII